MPNTKDIIIFYLYILLGYELTAYGWKLFYKFLKIYRKYSKLIIQYNRIQTDSFLTADFPNDNITIYNVINSKRLLVLSRPNP